MPFEILRKKWTAFRNFLSDLEKQFGEGAIVRFRPPDEGSKPSVIPSGSLALDDASGVGGYPRGRIVEVFGAEACGKTTLALHAILECQRQGGIAAYLDIERSFDRVYAEGLGIATSELLIAQPETAEKAFEMIEHLGRSGMVALIVVDTLAALVPQAEIDSPLADADHRLQARIISHALRRLVAVLHQSQTCLLFVNQIRQITNPIYGSQDVTPGGRALKSYAALRLEMWRLGGLKEDKRAAGYRSRIRVVKNKMAPPFQEADLLFSYAKGLLAAEEEHKKAG